MKITVSPLALYGFYGLAGLGLVAALPQLVSVSVILHHYPLEGHPLELWKGQSKVGLVAEGECEKGGGGGGRGRCGRRGKEE